MNPEAHVAQERPPFDPCRSLHRRLAGVAADCEPQEIERSFDPASLPNADGAW